MSILKAKSTEPEVMKISDVKQQLSSVVDHVYKDGARVLIEKSGIPVAAVVSIDDLRWIRERQARRDASYQAMLEISKAFEDVPLDELERQVDLAVAEVRAEKRRKRAAAEE